MSSNESADSLDPLWAKVEQAAAREDMPGVLFILRALADKGVWQAYARIGEIYERGAKGIDKDPAQALQWYRRALFDGDDPVAHMGLGRAYYSGVGTERDYRAARKHLDKALADGIPDAAIYLGMIYYGSLDVSQDKERAKKYFLIAANAEYFFAYFKLARIAFDERNYIKGLWLSLKGWFLGFKISRLNPNDPRLVGLGSASQR